MQKTGMGTNYPIELMRIIGVILISFTHLRHDFTTGTPYFILEALPRYGTLLLSVVSGYLFCINPPSGNLLTKKIKSLLIPYLIANGVVITLVLTAKAFGIDFLNRLEFDYTLITEGLFALHSPPVNPPTYFIRDLFIIFCLISLTRKHYAALIFIIPLLIFGKLLLRWDIAFLFLAGFVIAKYTIDRQNKLIINAIGITSLVVAVYFFDENVYKYIIALLVFVNAVGLKFTFVKTGAYTYLLHLYHSPMFIVLFAMVHSSYPNPYFEIFFQLTMAVLSCYLLLIVIRKFRLGFIAGNRV